MRKRPRFDDEEEYEERNKCIYNLFCRGHSVETLSEEFVVPVRYVEEVIERYGRDTKTVP